MVKESARQSLSSLLPHGQIFINRTALIAYESDAGMDKGMPEGIALPRSVEDVRSLVRWAAENGAHLIGRGAGTGLSGGAVADRGGIIVEFQHMNHILDLDTQGRSVIMEPALINLRLDENVKAQGLYFPPDPSSQRASTMGGNVAENSGGPHCFKYGVTTNYIAGLEVVLADGQCIRVGGPANDYPEYDLTGLLTGSEGTLGLITKIYGRLVRNPPGVATLLAVFDSIEQAGEAVSAVISAGLVPATMEMMDQRIIRMIEPYAQAGMPLDAGAVLIIEVDGYPENLDAQMGEVITILKQHGGSKMRVARDEQERYKIWLARKSAAGAVALLAPAYYTVDITVPRSRLAEMLVEVNRICSHYNLTSGHMFHAGDGNLHPMLLIPDPDDKALVKRVLTAGREMVKYCVGMDGSLTGEHGVGIEKRDYMPLMHNTAELMSLWDIKRVFDPRNTFNPGKIFPVADPSEGDVPFKGYDEQHTNIPVAETPPGEVFTPTTSEEAARGLYALSRAGRCVSINTPSRRPQATRIDTSKLTGIKTYAPDDLYITVGAGTRLSEVQAFLAERGKQVPIASPWPDATIGGLVATNTNAPLRMRYGSLRDLTLYTSVALPNGRYIRTGRPIVKNVAGYDLTKVFAGSRGTLGLLTEVTLKVSAQPRSRRTLLLPLDDLRDALRLGRRLLSVALNASALLLCQGYQSAQVPSGAVLLAYTAEGHEQDVQAELAQVRRTMSEAHAPEPLEQDTLSGTEIWRELLGQAVGKGLIARSAVPPRDLPIYVRDLSSHLDDTPFIADFANGFVYALNQNTELEAAKSWLNGLREPALALEGYTILMEQPEALYGQLDPLGYQSQGLALMRRLKARFDPNGILDSSAFALD